MTATQTTPAAQISGYRAGTWKIDPAHSEAAFTVRHLMVTKVRGAFTGIDGVIVTGEDPLDSRVDVTIDASSLSTGNPDRDAHVRSADFLDVEQFPTFAFHSTGVREEDGDLVVAGELTLHGVTKPVELQLEVNGFQAQTPFGDSRVGFSATTEINRKDFGVEFNTPLEGGGVALGEKVKVDLEIQAILQSDAGSSS
jgi:polyisoprenoid-binding protein YceI